MTLEAQGLSTTEAWAALRQPGAGLEPFWEDICFLKAVGGLMGFRGFHTVFNRVIAGYIGVARECMGRSLGAPSDPYGSTVYRISELQLSYGTNYGVIAVVTYHFVA